MTGSGLFLTVGSISGSTPPGSATLVRTVSVKFAWGAAKGRLNGANSIETFLLDYTFLPGTGKMYETKRRSHILQHLLDLTLDFLR